MSRGDERQVGVEEVVPFGFDTFSPGPVDGCENVGMKHGDLAWAWEESYFISTSIGKILNEYNPPVLTKSP